MSLDTAIARVSQLEAAFFPTAAAQTTTPTADTTSLSGSGMTGATFASTLQGAMATQGVTPGPSAGNAMVQIAESQIGQSEQPPGSNDGPAISMYRAATAGAAAGEPWCAYFASWVARQAGEPIGRSGQGLGYGRASGGIQAILSTAGQSPQAQIAAIQNSGWASSGYPSLPGLYASLAG